MTNGLRLPSSALSVEYDPLADVLTIEGVKYSAMIFRELGFLELGRWYKIVARNDGTLTITVAPPGARVLSVVDGGAL